MKTKWILAVITFLLIGNNTWAQNNWPLSPQNTQHRIWGGYGQYEIFPTIGEYFHEGLDLIEPAGNNVLSRNLGRIVEVKIHTNGYYNFLRIGADTSAINLITRSYLYLHIAIANHPVRGTRWRVGDTISKGAIVGTVQNGGLTASHLHFEYNNKDNDSSWEADTIHRPYENIADIEGNPITQVNPNTDNVNPKIDTALYFRKAADEGKNAAYYYSKRTPKGKKVIQGGIDPVVMSGDSFHTFANNFLINVRKIESRVQAVDGGNGYGWVQAVDFTGRFLETDIPTPGRNSYLKFREPGSWLLTHVMYENDGTCGSTARDLSGGTGQRRYFYILSNIDTVNNNIERRDTSFYWDTKVRDAGPVKWNNKYTDAAHQADSNKSAYFPDGRYAVSARATGYGGTDQSTVTDTVFVNNFNEFLFSCDTIGRDKDTFCIGQPVYIKGKGYPKNRTFRVFVVKDTNWVNGKPIPSDSNRVAAATVSSDGQGLIQPVRIWNAYVPNGSPDKGYDILLDFDKDSIYTDTLETFTVDSKDENMPGRKGIIGADTMKVKLKVENVRCFGDSDGCVRATITGGKKPYKMRIRGNGLDTSITDTFYCRLKAGKYLLTVIGFDSCQVRNDSFEVKQPAKLKISKDSSNVSCYGECDGRIEIHASGGTRPYTYYWNDHDTSITDSIRENLCPGMYILTLVDSNGCVVVDTTIITEPPQLTLSLSATHVRCKGDCDGSILATVNGGTKPYTYNWSGGGSGDSLRTGLCAGWYYLTVTDSNDCSVSDSIEITEPDSPLVLNLDSVQNVTCHGYCNGVIYTHASGGTPGYTYGLVHNSDTSYQYYYGTFYGLCPGSYTVFVTDANGCTDSVQVNITEPDSMSLSLSGTDPTCWDSYDGSVCANVSGGNPPYTYYWYPGGTGTACMSGLGAGWYSVTVTDSNGCSVYGSISLEAPSPVMISGWVSPDSCDAGIGAISTSISGGTPAYSCSWSSGGGSCSGLSGLHEGYYTITATDANGCTGSAIFYVPNYYCDSIITDTIIKDTAIAQISRNMLSVSPINRLSIHKVQPNPFGKEVEVYYTLPEKGQAELTVLDLLGRELIHVDVEANKGINVQRLPDTSVLARGVYLLRISYNNSSSFIRISKE